MDKYHQTFMTWDKVAKMYEDRFLEFDLYDETYDLFLASIPEKDANVLDLGCGPGNITRYLLKKNPNLRVKGIDISENMIQLARRNNPSANFERMDLRHISDLKENFDAIICGFAIPYLSKRDCTKLISDCKMLLKASGVMYFSFVEGNYSESGFIASTNGERMYFYYHKLVFIKNQLTKNSFKINDMVFKNYKKADGREETHTILLIRKLSFSKEQIQSGL